MSAEMYESDKRTAILSGMTDEAAEQHAKKLQAHRSRRANSTVTATNYGVIDVIDGWEIRDHGPGFWAADPDDKISVWVESQSVHVESLHHNDCDVPLRVVARLAELRDISTGNIVP